MRFSLKCLFAAVAVTLGASSGQVFAAPLPAGTALFGPSTEGDPVGGTSLTSITAGFSVASAFSGTLKSEVISGDTSNPLGGLTFIYTLSNDGVAGPNSIGRLSLAGLSPFAIDASYQTPTSDVAPASVDRNPSGDVVGFNFVPLATDPATGFLAPGSSSALLVLQTDAVSFARGNFGSLIDGGVGTVDALIPVPEPSTVALSLIGLAAAAVLARRR